MYETCFKIKKSLGLGLSLRIYVRDVLLKVLCFFSAPSSDDKLFFPT